VPHAVIKAGMRVLGRDDRELVARAYVRVHTRTGARVGFSLLIAIWGGDADSGAFPRVFTLR